MPTSGSFTTDSARTGNAIVTPGSLATSSSPPRTVRRCRDLERAAVRHLRPERFQPLVLEPERWQLAATPSTQPTKATTSHSDFFETLFGGRGSPFDRFGGFGGFSSTRTRSASREREQRGRNAVRTPRFPSKSRSTRRSGEPNGRFNCRSRSRARPAAAPAKCGARSVRRVMAQASCGAPRRWR